MKGEGKILMNQNIRRAGKNDVPALIVISQTCFPDYLEWCTHKQARRWWSSIVESNSCETWLYLKEDNACGFYRLVTDPIGHQIEKAQLRPNTLTLLWAMLVNPGLLKKKLGGKINRIWRKRLQLNAPEFRFRKSLWPHSLAVIPSMQKKGIGRELMLFSESRALELGFDSIKFFVKEDNIGSIKFCKKLGYEHTGYMDDCLFFIKLLESSSLRIS